MIIYTKNKKAYHDYTIIESFEAGIKLTGAEVKSIRKSNIQLKGSYVMIKNDVLILTGAHISRPNHIAEFIKYNEVQDRILLMKKKEILKLKNKVLLKGYTLLALEVYQPNESNHIKVKIALCKGNKDYDKREILKKKDAQRTAQREMKNYDS